MTIVRDKKAYAGYAEVERDLPCMDVSNESEWDEYAQYCIDRRNAILERETEVRTGGRRASVFSYLIRRKLRPLKVDESVELPMRFYPCRQTTNCVANLNAQKCERYSARWCNVSGIITITRIK